MGSRRRDKVIKFLDQFEKSSNGGSRSHGLPAPFWDMSAGQRTTETYARCFAMPSMTFNTETSIGLPTEIDVSLTCDRSNCVTCNLNATPR